MKFYEAVYLDELKREKKGLFFLPNERSVRLHIFSNNWIPLRIREKNHGLLKKEFFSRDYKIKFLRGIYFNMKAGLSAGESLMRVIEQEQKPAKRAELEPALEVLRQGGSFSDAIMQIAFFDRTIIAVLKTGEKTGAIREAVNTAIEYLENRKSNWKTITSALGWLSFDIITAVSTVFGLRFKFLPWLKNNGVTSADPQAIEKFQKALKTAFMVNDIMIVFTIAVIFFSVFFVAILLVKRASASDFFEKILSRIPIIKSVLYDGSLSATFYVASKMLSGGVSFDLVSETTANATNIPRIKNFWLETHRKVLNGYSIAKAMDSDMLSRTEKMEISTHQNKKQLAELFGIISEERAYKHKKGTRRLILTVTAGTILYTAAVVMVSLYAVWIQNEAFMSGLKDIGNF